jgi:hypothetical protein
MASEATIKRQIAHTVGDDYSSWTIGVTQQPVVRKAQVGNPLSWLHWKANSERVALNVERHFLQKGMKPDTRVISSGQYVYIY